MFRPDALDPLAAPLCFSLWPSDVSPVSTVEPPNKPIDVPNFAADGISRQAVSLLYCCGIICSIKRLCIGDPSFDIQAEDTVGAHQHYEMPFATCVLKASSATRKPSSLTRAMPKGLPPSTSLWLLRKAITASLVFSPSHAARINSFCRRD